MLIKTLERVRKDGWLVVATESGKWLLDRWWTWVTSLPSIAALIGRWTETPADIKFALYVLLAIGGYVAWKQFTQSSNSGLLTAAPPNPQPPALQRPFLVLYKSKNLSRVGTERDWPHGNHVLKIKVINAGSAPRDNVDVYITAEARRLDARGPVHHRLEKCHLKNRREVTLFNGGQDEDYVLISTDFEGNAFWGDHTKIEQNERVALEGDCQYIVTVSVSSSSTHTVSERFVIFNATTPQILPTFPDPTNWVINERR